MTKEQLKEWEGEVEDLIDGVEGNGRAAGGRTDRGDGEQVGAPHYAHALTDWIQCLLTLNRLAEHRQVEIEVDDGGTVWLLPDVPTDEEIREAALEARWEATNGR